MRLHGIVLLIGIGWSLIHSSQSGYCPAAETQATASTSSQQTVSESALPTLEQLEQTLTQDNPLAVRKAACRQMLNAGSADGIWRLAAILSQGKDSTAQLAVCEALVISGEPPEALLPPLISLLDNADPRLQQAAVITLGAFRKADVVGQLLQVARDRNAPVSKRIATVRAMSNARDCVKAIDALIEMLEDKDSRIRYQSAMELHDITMMEYGTDAPAWKQWWKHGRMELLATLSYNLRRQERSNEVLTSLYSKVLEEVLSRTTNEQRDARLQEGLSSPLPEERLAVVQLIGRALLEGKLPSDATLATLRNLLDDSEPNIRREAVLVLRDLRNPSDSKLLLDHITSERDHSVRPVLYNALGRVGNASAIPVVLRALNDTDQEVMAEAVTALGFLIQQYRQPPNPVVQNAVEVFAKHFTPLPEDPSLRGLVVDAIAKMCDATFRNTLREEAGNQQMVAALRLAAVQGLEMLGDSSNLDVIAERLSDDDSSIREAAAKAYGTLGTTANHLHILAARFDPDVEKVKSVQAQLWEACRTIFSRLSLQEQLAVLDSYPANQSPDSTGRFKQLMETDAVSAERFVQLVAIVEQHIASDNQASPSVMGPLRLRMADALVMLNRDNEAVTAYEKALLLPNGTSASTRQDIRMKIFSIALRASQYEKAFEVIATDSATSRPNDRSYASAISKQLRSLLDAGYAEAVCEFLKRYDAPQLTRDADTIQQILDIQRKAAEALRSKDAESVHKWIADLRAGGDAAVSATVMIKKLGARAIPGLRAEVEKLVRSRDKADKALERLLIGLIKDLIPAWTGYDPDSPADEKMKALSLLPKA